MAGHAYGPHHPPPPARPRHAFFPPRRRSSWLSAAAPGANTRPLFNICFQAPCLPPLPIMRMPSLYPLADDIPYSKPALPMVPARLPSAHVPTSPAAAPPRQPHHTECTPPLRMHVTSAGWETLQRAACAGWRLCCRCCTQHMCACAGCRCCCHGGGSASAPALVPGPLLCRGAVGRGEEECGCVAGIEQEGRQAAQPNDGEGIAILNPATGPVRFKHAWLSPG